MLLRILCLPLLFLLCSDSLAEYVHAQGPWSERTWSLALCQETGPRDNGDVPWCLVLRIVNERAWVEFLCSVPRIPREGCESWIAPCIWSCGHAVSMIFGAN